jgi:tetratricopeptide (TPR) repeat protein
VRRIFVFALAAVLAVCAAYANSFENGFHFDDFHTVTDNPAVRSLENVPRFFTDATTFSVLPANRTYRPTVSTSLALDYALGHGYVPLWFHVSTFAVFLLLLALLWAIYVRAMEATSIFGSGESPGPKRRTRANTRDFRRSRGHEADVLWALGGAAWFGLHPAMAETVNYVIQRGDIFCTTGCVGALVLWAQWPQGRRWGIYLLPLVFALLSKPPAAVFPALLLFWVFFFETDGATGARWKRSFLAILPSLAVTAMLMLLQSRMTPKTFFPSMISPTDYRLTQAVVWLRYFAELFLPLHLNVDTDLPAYSQLNAAVAAGLVFVAALSVAIWLCARRRRLYPIAFGLIWFVVTQLPTSLYPLSETENDHRMFFSFPGLILAVLWGLRLLAARMLRGEARAWLRPVLVACAFLALSGYAWGVHVRNRVWRTEDSLWRDDVQKSPHNGRGLMIYGLTRMNAGDNAGALDYFTRALKYTPNYATLEVNLGIVNGLLGRQDAAEQHFLRAISLSPADDTTHSYYGRWLKERGRYADAGAQLRQAIAINPVRAFPRDVLIETLQDDGDAQGARQAAKETLAAIPGDAEAAAALAHPVVQNAAFWINLSLTQFRNAQYEASIVSAHKALAMNPDATIAAEADNNIGAAAGATGKWDEAIKKEREALKLDPALQIAQNNLAVFLEKKAAGGGPAASAAGLIDQSLALNRAGKYEESLTVAQSAVKVDPTSAVAWNNVAANDEALHRWDQAIAAAKKAVALKPDFQLAKNNLAWSESQKKLERATQ